MYCWKRIACLLALGTCWSLAAIGSTNAEDETSVLVKKSDTSTNDVPVLPPQAKPDTPTNKTQDLFAPAQPASATPQPKVGLPTSPQPQTKSTVKRPFMQPAQTLDPGRGQLNAQIEPMPTPQVVPQAESLSPAGPPVLQGRPIRNPSVRPTPRIKYDTDHDARKMYRSGQIQLVVAVQNPADGCLYEIPLSIPACCAGEPRIAGAKGLLGRGIVEYCWACGFKAKIKFRDLLHDVKVDYEGD